MPETPEQAAVKAGAATALITGIAATLLANPVCWAAVLYGTYRMGKAAYRNAKYNRDASRQAQEDQELFL